MELVSPSRTREWVDANLMRWVPLLVILSTVISPVNSSPQTLRIDLHRMSEMLDTRYYIAEKGEIPPSYILFGDLYLYPNFLDADFDLRQETVEFDERSRLVYRYRVPGHIHFLKREEKRGAFYYYKIRPVSEPEIEATVSFLDSYIGTIRRNSTKQVWIEDVRYNLEKEREEKAGRGLLSVDIPIPLPKQLERIIGRGEESNLTVQGRERITIGGQSSWCANCPQTEGRPRQQKFPDLDMEQQLSVNLHGNIGEKINVEIQHSSQGEMQAVNRVRINYRGFDDEIVKLIEMGDTDLILSGAQLVSYSGGAKGLFGIKGMAQVGPLDLTVIASKEEGETATGTFTAQGGQASEWTIPDYAFIKRQYFYFESPGSDFLSPTPGFMTVYPVIGGVDNDDIEVFVSLRYPHEWDQTEGQGQWHINAYADPENDGIENNIAAGDMAWDGRFKRLILGEDFELIQDYSSTEIKYVGIRLFRALDEDRALVTRYKAYNEATGSTFEVGDYGNFTQGDTLRGELICPPDDEFGPDSTASPYYSTWNMMMRNVYSLGSANIEEGTLTIRIEDLSTGLNPDIHRESGISYLRLFGLDRYDREGNLKKDDRIDDRPGILDLEQGYIMFPWYEAFNPPLIVMEQARFIDRGDSLEAKFKYETLVRDSLIYNAVMTEQVRRDGNHYEIIVEASSGQRTFQLAAFDIIQESEVVSVDGVKLARGTDYEIDYLSGIVTLKGDILSEMTPDSRVSIDYQHKPLIGGGKSSLLGVGANLNLSKNTRINGTFLYNALGSPKYNPRVGEEPGRMMAADVNGTFQFNPRWMTSLVNLLPRVDTDAPSSLNLSGEVAVSIPNPNVKGEAFIDDMEGIEESDMLSLIRRTWYEASPPIDTMTMEPFPFDSIPEFYWFNPSRTDQQEYLITSRRDLNPGLDPRENSTVTSLFIKAMSPNENQWCGIVTGFPSGGFDLSTAQYLEIWVNDFDTVAADRGGVLHIDFGKIDEDFYRPDETAQDGRGILNDEDKPPYTWTIEEDIGFIGETGSYPTELSDKTYDPARGIFTGINSRRYNGIHDTEDLNKNGRLDETNAYYTLELDLSSAALIDVRKNFPRSEYYDYWAEKAANEFKAWRMYRLDIADAKLISPTGSEPRWDAIQHMRIWISDVDELGRPGGEGGRGNIIEIAGLKFVGNRWQFNGIRNVEGELLSPTPLGQKITIGTINNKDDPQHYYSPYSVQEEEGIANREQSLILEFENFADSTSFRAIKRFFGQGQDYQQYRELQFFINPGMNATETEFYLQIAYDSLNYYEIEVPLTEEDADQWLWVTVNLSDLTNMKFMPGDTLLTKTIADAVNPNRTYMAKLLGNPTLFKVRYLYIGLRNMSGQVIDHGRLWFNDLRLGGVRRDIDHAERTSVTADFANVLQLSAGWQRTGPEFRSLRQKRGSGVTNSSLSLSGKSKVNHFIPTAGFNLPVSMRYSNVKALPRYIPQSDVEIADPDMRDSLRTVNNSYSINVSMIRSGSQNPLMKHLFDNLKTSFSYSKRTVFSPNSRDTTKTMSGSLNYQVYFRKSRQLGLFRGIKWRYWLSNFSLTSSAARKTRRYFAFSGDRFVKRPSTYDAGWNNDMSMLYEPFESIKMDFRRSEKRNLAIDHDFHGIPIGVQTSYNHNYKLGFQPKGRMFLLSDLNTRFEYTSSYNEDLRPSLRQEDDPFGTRNVGAKRTMNFVFDVDIGRYAFNFGKLVKLFGEEEKEEKRVISRGRGFPSATKEEDYKKILEEYRRPRRREEGEEKRQIPSDIEPPDTAQSIPVPPVVPPPERTETTEKEAESKPSAISDISIQRSRIAAQQDTSRVEEKKEEGEEAVEVDTVAVKKTDPLLIFKQMIRLLGKIDPVKTNIRMDHQSNYQRLYDRAGLAYQFGLTDKSGVRGKSGDEENDPERASDVLIVDLVTGIGLTQNIDVDIRYSLTKRHDNYSGRITDSDRLTWPKLNINWRGMEKSRLLQRLIKQSDFKFGFERSITTDVRGEETSYTFNPNWNLVWKNKLTTNLSFSYRQTTTVEKGQELWTKSWSASMNLRYNFEGSKGFSLPIPILRRKKFKFKSTLTTDVSLGYMSVSKYNQPPAGTLSISPRVSYRFSTKMSGSLSIDYKRSSGGIMGYINHSIGMHLTAEFTF